MPSILVLAGNAGDEDCAAIEPSKTSHRAYAGQLGAAREVKKG